MISSAAGPDLTTGQLYALLRLRVAVFIIEQRCPYPELDGLDLLGTTRHFWSGDSTVDSIGSADVDGCLRVTLDPGGVLRVGRVCTALPARGTGVGAALMDAAIHYIGDADSVLSAQTYATGFYERFGYRTVGDPYDDDGIEHITMVRSR